MRAFVIGVGRVLPGPRVLALLLGALTCVRSLPAAAQDHAPRLVVLHRDGTDLPAAQRDEVDRLLLTSVAGQLRFASAYASDVPLEDVELAAGCSMRDADCTQRIAESLGADWLLVRELSKDRAGHVFLTLIAHDGPGALVTRRVVSQLASSDAASAPRQVVPMLVERLYPKTPTGLDERLPRHGWSAARVVGWSAAGTGVSLLAVGTAMGVLSRRDHGAYEHTAIHRQEDVDRADSLLSRSQQRARIANGLLLGGGAAGLAGAATLLWSYLRPSAEQRSVELAMLAAPSGLALSVAGAWRGGL
ncbi:MAG: hypothetical protein JWN04_6137 [Myxococcaceae bacterium]|nr:hypothetical protein [Myxococcaceae bacterium]